MYDYDHILSPANVAPGLSDTIYIAPIDWFSKVAEPVDNGYTAKTRILVQGEHEFNDDKGFLENICKPFANQYIFNGRTMQLSAHLSGSYEELHAAMTLLIDVPVIVLFRDVHCGIIYQIGTSAIPAFINGSFSTGVARGGGAKGYDIQCLSHYHNTILYKGEINIINTIPALMITEDGRLIVSEEGSIITT